MAQRTRIPILLLTGFLGSGKTSLLSRWLRAPEFASAMVVVNELGEVGLDDRLVQTSSEAPVLLENGCACCEAAEDLNATLERLFWARLHREIPRFEWMLIETTGIADPAPIMAALAGNELVAERYRLAGVVTTLDARRGPAQIEAHPECRSQIVQADAAVLTKTDIASPAETEAARVCVRALRPDVALFESAGADLSAAAIVQALAAATARPAPDAGDAAHSPEVSSAFAALSGPFAWPEIERALGVLFARYGKRILRLKGVAQIEGEAMAQAIQAAPDEAVERRPLPGATPAKTGLTIIAQFVPAGHIARDFLSMLPQPRTRGIAPAFPQRARG